jgi:hypothetical protein
MKVSDKSVFLRKILPLAKKHVNHKTGIFNDAA